MDTDYGKGMRYEILIKRAHKCERGQRNGAYGEALTNLMTAESGKKMTGLPSAQKQLDNLKNFLTKAFQKFQKKKLTDDEAFQLHKLMTDTLHSYSSDDLIKIVDSGLNLTDRFK